MKIWKLLGVAGLAGVAAGGAIIARDQRQRAQLTPDEVRERLHQRLAEAEKDDGAAAEAGDRGPGTGDVG
ncbi:hypothetical protein [Nocardioides alkalitolerans]|uniref:hypothetical protein n=1 Tax=Nocardioides alkalitolerans TaxID=281714 RepID=UPI0004117415|nr:hypothetical protein [Nocardioides alkalitolerans]